MARKTWMQLAAFSTAGIPSASVVKDGKRARACFPIKQAAPRLAEQITTGESECSRTSIQTNQLPAEIAFFPPHISSLLLLLSSLIPSFPSLLLKRWHRAAPKPIFFFLFVLLAGLQKVLDSFMVGQKARFKNKTQRYPSSNLPSVRFTVKPKTLLMGPKELWHKHTHTHTPVSLLF